jgi:nucleoside-diphosphate-sugar epimerase
MRRVLVTGATGGLGRILVPALAQAGCDVVATGRQAGIGRGLESPGVRFICAELATDALAPMTEGVDTVFHLAARSAPWGPPVAFEAANILATGRLLAAAKASGSRRFVHVSTPSIYAEPRDRLGLTEDSPPARRWANDYARTKHEAERLALQASGEALQVVVLRPRAIVSPFDTVLLPRLLRAAARGRLVLPGGGRAEVELTDARDVVSALLLAAGRAEALQGQAFNLSGGQPLALAAIAALVFERMGRPIAISGINRRLALWLATGVEVLARAWPGQSEPPLTRYGAMVAGWTQTFDLTAARERLGWRPVHAPHESLAWALDGMAAQNGRPHA